MLLKRINANSKKALKTAWSKSIALTTIVLGCWFFIGLLCKQGSDMLVYNYRFSLTTNPVVNAIIVIFVFFIIICSIINISLFYTGVKKFSTNIVSGNNSSLRNIFHFLIYKDLRKRAQKLSITLFLIKFLKILLWNLPTLFFFIFLKINAQSLRPNILTALIFVGCFICLVFTLIALYRNNIFFVAQFLFINNTHLSVSQILTLSKIILKNDRKNIFKYYIRKIPFFLLFIFIFPIFYFYPKYIISDAIYAKFFIERFNKGIILSVSENL